MVAQSIFRDARVAIAAALAGAALATVSVSVSADPQKSPSRTGPRQAAIVIDLARGDDTERETNRSLAVRALGQTQRLSPVVDGELEAALGGDTKAAFVATAKQAFASVPKLSENTADCASIETATGPLIIQLAAAESLGMNARAELAAVYGARFRCAHEKGDASAALRAAGRVRRLGVGNAPKNVSPEVWALYPELDGSANVTLAALTIESEPSGARVFIDHEPRGTTPLTVHLPKGPHIVATGSTNGSDVRAINVTAWTHKERLTPAPAGRWKNVASLVSALRTARKSADASSIGEVMSLAGVDYALVMISGGTIEAWQSRQGSSEVGARRIGARRDAKTAALMLSEAVGASRAPDPSTLLRETDAQRAARAGGDADEPPAKWWVYAAIVGAAAVGAGIIIFGPSGDDTQRFEITLP